MPTRAMSHIQNTAPAPPSEIATATPIKLPVPTRAANEVQSAWKEDIPWLELLRLVFKMVNI